MVALWSGMLPTTHIMLCLRWWFKQFCHRVTDG
ncbi:hypothetical protein SORBI_3006G025550 [Sorghum bicolor]|uniref:Uncharacterized protein n=1 Tax=Sorghum bicolor TaxID=4558 RepID=A0A1Z5RBS4_SORBI|nr:hypothetical protein SORBI_3006G025550 [Sorghum bicolor]